MNTGGGRTRHLRVPPAAELWLGSPRAGRSQCPGGADSGDRDLPSREAREPRGLLNVPITHSLGLLMSRLLVPARLSKLQNIPLTQQSISILLQMESKPARFIFLQGRLLFSPLSFSLPSSVRKSLLGVRNFTTC